jgi:hypothetical protein
VTNLQPNHHFDQVTRDQAGTNFRWEKLRSHFGSGSGCFPLVIGFLQFSGQPLVYPHPAIMSACGWPAEGITETVLPVEGTAQPLQYKNLPKTYMITCMYWKYQNWLDCKYHDYTHSTDGPLLVLERRSWYHWNRLFKAIPTVPNMSMYEVV